MAIRVAYQGEPGAYSEVASLKFFVDGADIVGIPRVSFDDVFKAVESGSADFGCVPFENTLGGSVHGSYDCLVKYPLHVVSELQLRVRHCLMVLPGVSVGDVKKVQSHPQALAQCANFITAKEWEKVPGYDTAGSAQMIHEKQLRDTAAIASQRAATVYGLSILEEGIEDELNNYTRFLLLSRQGIAPPLSTPVKTSIVFTMNDIPGVLFKALSCFALRDIDLTKIESRPAKDIPTPTEGTGNAMTQVLFYVDIKASQVEDRCRNALKNLKEIAPFLRVFGSYPEALSNGLPACPIATPVSTAEDSAHRCTMTHPSHRAEALRVGIIGFGNFGQFLAKAWAAQGHTIFATSRSNYSAAARHMGASFTSDPSEMLDNELDVVVLAPSVLSFQKVLRSLPLEKLRNTLVVDVLSVKEYPKQELLATLPPESDILCTHPMFGPESGKDGWQGLPCVYEKVRIRDQHRCARFLSLFDEEGCRVLPMACDIHDRYAAGSQFVTHLTGRLLAEVELQSTPINTKGFETLLQLMENTCKDSFDLFAALYQHNPTAGEQMEKMQKALEDVKEKLQRHGSN